MEKLIDTRIQLNMDIDKEEMFGERRARANWLQLEDKNSAFFHRFTLARKRINTIHKLEFEGGQEISDDEGISSLIRMATTEGLLKGVKASRRRPAISHLLFANDCILFGEAMRGKNSKRNIEGVRTMLRLMC
ncbi:hypothetical protein J1N35_022628 [Gossypium stocksii]|uniref:Reverse transcriptase domain-containing protein n=1 Tax=Gossypium stocksii TaxID=47602 RepID=A0A9D4A2X9_9ROSI|nr:hypothetical protein J1N35_022628 [Gossypium stocksii]